MNRQKSALAQTKPDEPFQRNSGYRPAQADPEEIVALVRAWEDEDDDDDEQRETFEFLKRTLDEHRKSARKLFP